jgi:hypothetical protein
MAKISLPERGQPLDVSYISRLASAINDLSETAAPSLYKYFMVDTKTAAKQSVKIAESRILGAYIEVATSASRSKGISVDFSYDFSGFKYAPIVTATPQIVGNATSAGKNVSVVIKSVTTSKVEGSVIFNESGDVAVAVNLIIIGIPN